MLEIYYTGAPNFNEEQKDIDKSLGGFLSSTRVPNDIIGNLFGDISLYGLHEQLRETRGIILHNNSEDLLENLYIWIDTLEESLGKFTISAVQLEEDSVGEIYMESIGSIRGTPFSGDFHEVDGEDNKKLLVEQLEPGGYLGLWIRRELVSSDLEELSCTELYSKFKDSEPISITGSIDIILEWD